MADDRAALAGLSEERVAAPPQFAPAQHVMTTAAMLALVPVSRSDACCPMCGQVLVPISLNGTHYSYNQEARGGLVLAHLIQAHGWTRESVGDLP